MGNESKQKGFDDETFVLQSCGMREAGVLMSLWEAVLQFILTKVLVA
jgi:hypothetical protein